MNAIQKHLDVNEFSRPGRGLRFVDSIVVHWTANPQQGWQGVWQWWQDAPLRRKYGSAHAIADDDRVVEVMPLDEMAYHCGSASGYTRWAQQRYGTFATTQSSPNLVTLGLELCVENAEGEITDATWHSAVEWLAQQITANGLDPHRDIVTHQMVVGWKDCPKWFVTYPAELERLRADVKRAIELASG